MIEMMLEAEYGVNIGKGGLRDWHDTDVKGLGLGWYWWDILKDQKVSVGVKGCVFVCALKGGGDVAYMKDVTGLGLTEGHKKGCFGCVA